MIDKKPEPERLSPSDMLEIAGRLSRGEEFTSANIPDKYLDAETLGLVFRPIGHGLLSQFDTDFVGAVSAPIETADNRLPVGLPSFPKCRVIHVEDWEQLWEAAKQLCLDQSGDRTYH